MNFIFTKADSITNITCSSLISTFEQSKNKVVSNNIETINFGSDLFRWRTFDSVLYKELSASLTEYIQKYNLDTDIFDTTNLKDNGFFLQKLIKNKGNVDFHNDFFSSEGRTRILTYIWFLNDIKKGGEIVFWNNKTKISPEKGTLILFPSNWTYSYKHTQPLEEDQYIIIGGIYTY